MQARLSMSYNLKRGFHRVFAILTIVWVILCILWPIHEREQFFTNFGSQHAQMRANCEYCAEYQSNCNKIIADCKKGVDELDHRMFTENPLSHWYAEAWPYILVFAVVVPPLAYGVIRGAVAIVLWVSRGFQHSPQ